MNKVKILIDRFDLACRGMEMLGAHRKEEQSEIVDEYNAAKAALIKYIKDLQSLIME